MVNIFPIMFPAKISRSLCITGTRAQPICFNAIRQSSNHSLVAEKDVRTSLKVNKKPSKPPFMKNVFLGIYDKDMLVYPELDKPRLQELKKRMEPVKSYFKSNVNPEILSSLKIIPNEIRESLKQLGLYGQSIPESYGGSDQTATETAYINEVIGNDIDIALTLYSHNFLATQSILMYGTAQQKEKYLPLLATGELTAAFCMSESISSSDLASLLTTAEPNEDNPDMYLVNGKKLWVINGGIANLFIVLVKYNYKSHHGKMVPLVRLMIVEREYPGITVSPPKEHIGLKASNICEVHFNNTPVPKENFIGNEMQGFEMCTQVLSSGRYNIGAITVTLLKNLLSTACSFVIDRRQFDRQLIDCERIQDKVVEIATRIYTLESMTYLTTGILDTYESADCLLELAIIKIFSFTEGRYALDLIMELMGGRAFLESEIVQKYFKDFRTMEVFDGTTDIAKLMVALLGLQHTGITLHESNKKARFPYDNAGFVFKRFFENRLQIKDEPKLTLGLFEQLHPSLTIAANELEYCVHRLQFAVSVLFERYGSEVVNQQIELMRITDAAVKIYAMTAVLGRSSRSYCLGLRNGETEVKYAMKICSAYKKIVKQEINYLLEGIPSTGDIVSTNYGPDIFRHHGYYLEHPLERTY
ncbi:complex I assembly factor ACAD9, mitochondrial-like [Macrosteles quadrilineatus]|uniref:complex I assembly factor ACAD9, mitochondrial-like n=1 Tax=Macrosteles quadrilineatus TaxID=74068 RepID=UPI0023E11707|nr:complex I assembly factor ACAD9, mitochondrial-like [Macrosteles quadrilineatus]